MPSRRYWPGLVLAVPWGALLGAGAGYLVAVAPLGWGSVNALVQSGAVLGAIDACVAAVGAVSAVWLEQNKLERPTNVVLAGSLGAGVGAGALLIVFGLLFAVIGGIAALPLALFAAVAVAIVAGGVCALTMVLSDQLSRLHAALTR